MNIREILMKGLQVPSEVIGNMPVISIFGNGDLLLENFISLSESNSSLICFDTAIGILRIEGHDLQICFLRQGEIGISGYIDTVKIGE